MMQTDYFEQVEPFPSNNFFSLYNLRILSHFLDCLPILFLKGKYIFFRTIIHKILFKISQVPENEIEQCFKESLDKNKLSNPKTLEFLGNGLVYPLMLYMAIRMTKPLVVIETGVNAGRSTSFILQALHDNDKGKLFSFDLGESVSYDSEAGKQNHILPSNLKTGWLVPGHLKDRWTLLLGNSKEELPKLLEKLGSIDLFSHDGEHTDENMMFEYNLAMKYLKSGGVLMSDDVLFSQNGPKSGYLHNVPHYNTWLNFSKNHEDGKIINFKVGYCQKTN